MPLAVTILERATRKASTTPCDDGTPLLLARESLRTHPVLFFLFSQRAAFGPNHVTR